LLVFSFILSVSSDGLYGIVTEFSFSGEDTLLWTIKYDRTTGSWQNVTENMIYSGGSATIDGISTFDQNKGVYYFATDFAGAFIFASDVINKRTLAPIFLNVASIEGLIFDNHNNHLYVLAINSGKMVLIGVTPQGTRTVAAIPPSYNAGYIMVGAVDISSNFYLAAKVGAEPQPTYAIATFNTNTGQILSSVNFSSDCENLFPQRLVWDTITSTLIGGGMSLGANNDLEYWFLRVNPRTGQCTKKRIAVNTGIVTCWTYDSTKGYLWLGEAVNGGAYLYFYNIAANILSTPTRVSGFVVPESIEYSLL